MDEDYRAVRDDLMRQRAADPDGEISAEQMERGFGVAEAMGRENDETQNRRTSERDFLVALQSIDPDAEIDEDRLGPADLAGTWWQRHMVTTPDKPWRCLNCKVVAADDDEFCWHVSKRGRITGCGDRLVPARRQR